MSEPVRYIVFGLYLDQDPPQRWASGYNVDTPEEAERLALEEYDRDGSKQLTIAGVIDVVRVEVVA